MTLSSSFDILLADRKNATGLIDARKLRMSFGQPPQMIGQRFVVARNLFADQHQIHFNPRKCQKV